MTGCGAWRALNEEPTPGYRIIENDAMDRPPLPSFTTAAQKALARRRHLEYARSSPSRACLYYRQPLAQSLGGRAAIEAFLTRKWQHEFDYRLIREVRAFRENRVAVRFAYEWHDESYDWGDNGIILAPVSPAWSEDMLQHVACGRRRPE